LLAQYVLYAVEDIKGVDLGLFDFDMEANMYFFVMTADEQILLRYTGRDSRGPVSYYSMKSHESALVRGLERYRAHKRGEVQRDPRPEPEFQDDYKDYIGVRDRLSKNACVRCHHIAEARLVFKQRAGTLDKLQDVWQYPDGRRLGLVFEVDTGTVLSEVSGPAAEAGLQVGDELVEVNGRTVKTYGDIQYRLHRTPHDARRLDLTIHRAETTHDITLELPPFWKASDAIVGQHRFLALEPFPGFWARALDDRERAELELSGDGLATRVTRFWAVTGAYEAGLREGDVIIAIDGQKRSSATRDARVYLKLFRETGDEVTLTVLRDDRERTITYTLTAER